MKNLKENLMHGVFLGAACVSILAVALICIFLFANGIPAIFEIGPLNFLGGMRWKPLNDIYGIFPMIVGSIYVTAGAIIVGVPIGILCAVFMARFCPKKIYPVLKPMIELMAGIPSIVYGFFGLVVIVPLMQDIFGGSGKSVLTASILLGIMILPTIIGVSESAIRAVPESYYEGALALGDTHERSVFRIRHYGRSHPGDRPGDRRDHGCDHGGRQPGGDPRKPSGRRAYADGQHRAGDGLCGRFT